MYNTQHTCTCTDYFTDVCTFVEPGFARRLADMALEEVLRRSSSAGVAALDRGPAAALAAMGAPGAAAVARGDPGDAVLQRLIQDERDVQVGGMQVGLGVSYLCCAMLCYAVLCCAVWDSVGLMC